MTASEDQEQARKGANSEKPGAGVGAILRGARLARDEDLREVAAALRIRLPYLQAIESGAIEDLPGVTYGIGFVRAYASYLDLDSNEIVDRFKVEARGMTQRTQLQFPEPLPGNRVPGAALLLIVLLLAGGVYGVWLYSSSQNMTVIEAVQAVPDRLRSLIEEEPAQEISTTPDTGADIAPLPPVETVPEAAQTEDTAAMPATDGTTSETTDSDTSSVTPVPSTTASDATETPAPVTDTAQTSENSDIPAPPAQPETTAAEATSPEPSSSETPQPETETASQQQADALPEPQIPAAPPHSAVTQSAPAEEGASSPPQTAEDSAMTTENLPEPAAPTTTAPVPETSTPGMQAAESMPSPSAPAEIPTQQETQAAEAPTTPTESTTPSAITADDSRIIIQATQESWIQVKNAQGQILIEKLMLMGEIYRVPNRPGLTLSSGNIGALKLIVNGTMVPTIGSLGEVRRGIPLTPESLLP
ncbi:MAG: DUF4115 domain-containing protein [Alphaproteobacteria bacterium]|nr:DUF4115 domain-containing protein [Alphaproteobacteria bacterium]